MTSRRSLGIVLGSTILFMLTPMPLAAQSQLWVGPNVNMVSGTTWPDGDPFLQRQNEPSIAVSTRKTTHLMGFTNDYRSVDIPGLPEGKETGDSWLGVFKSFDGGLSWRSTLLPGYPQDASSTSPIHGYDAAADPVVRAGTNGLFYLSGIVFDRGDTARSGVFVTRYMDLDNKEHGDPIEYVDTTMVSRNEIGDFFIDKPWMAVDIPRPGAQWAQLDIVQDGIPIAQSIPCGNVYLAWAEIWGVPPLRRSRIMFSSSVDCGASWSAPLELSAPDTLNQGVSLAVSPTTGDVWVAWRQFETDPTYLSCAFGGGYWKNRPEEWPLEFIEMGGVTYSMADAIAILDSSTRGDATYILAQQLIPAKLNMAYAMAGAEMMDLIIAADAWLVDNPLGSKPGGQTKEDGLFIKDQLEAYNEGLLVAEGCTTSVVSPGTGNAILAMRLSSAGIVLGGPTMVAPIAPLEQGTSPISFRTNAYPTITVDNADPDRAYVAWTTRGEASPRGDVIEGDARIVVATSSDGLSWAPPSPVTADNPVLPGHQFKPSITFAGGKVLLTYLDLRLDRSGLFERFIADWPSLETYRHTVDVRVAAADPADQPFFTDYSLTNPPYPEPALPIQPSDQVSRYVFIPYPADPEAPNPDEVELLQFQYNPPNLPIFVGGTRPFFGDYIDIAPSPPFLPDGRGGWRFNSESEDGAVFHVTWTDNRDVEAPHDGDWSNYVPPQNPFSGGPSLFDPSQIVPDCNATPGGEGQTRIRDQNTYTARVSRGLHVASPGSARTADDLQRAFVIIVQNDTQQDRAFQLTVSADPGVNASFEQFASRAELAVEIPGFSSASRTVFVSSDQELPTVQVSVVEIDGLGGSIVADGLTSTILLNPDPTSPTPADPGLDLAEVYTPAMMNPAMMNLAMMNPAMMNPAMMNLAVYNLAMMNPAMMNPAMMNLAMMNPAMMNLAMMNPAMMNASVTDLTWEVRNEGNTAAAYSVNMVMDAPPEGFVYELLVYRLYNTPVADGCELTEEAQQQMLVHIIDPDLLSGALLDPGTTDPDLGNATFWIEPGDEVYVTLRVVDPDVSDDEVFDPTDLTVATVAQAVNTEDVAAGSTQPRYSIPDASLPMPYTMNAGRVQHTSTLLSDGRVLVTGGFNPVQSESSAEIYDPATGQFTPTGSMSVARAAHSATLLDNGTVLVVGVPSGGVPGPSAEIYDPATGTFEPTTGDLHAPRGGHSATKLPNGRVLITGGSAIGPGLLNSAEIYDPSTDGFELLPGTMIEPRVEHTATLLTDGTVLITGGWGGPSLSLDSAEIFNPVANLFTSVADTMSEARRYHSATLLPNGKVLIAGGILSGSGLSSTESADIYDPATGLFTPAGNMSDVRAGHIAEILPSGKILIAGGSDVIGGIGRVISSVNLFDWSTTTFTYVGHLTEARVDHSAVRLESGDILITGGTTPGTNGTDSFEIYHPGIASKMLRTEDLNPGRAYHTATLLASGEVFVVGGAEWDRSAGRFVYFSDAYLYQPAHDSFVVAEPLSVGRGRHTATLLNDGRVLIAGGLSNSPSPAVLDTAVLYDPNEDSYSAPVSMNIPRYRHTATLLTDGRVLLTGGQTLSNATVNSAEIYDPATNDFTSVPSGMSVERGGHQATLLPDGRILVTGGSPNVPGTHQTAEIWNPTAGPVGGFDPPILMTAARQGHSAVLLPNGTVLISGGFDQSIAANLDSMEVFDPGIDTFSSVTATLSEARINHLSTVMEDGSVLISGGLTLAAPPGSFIVHSVVEVFDATTGTVTVVDPLLKHRSSQTATRLLDGRVLFIGGWEITNGLATHEAAAASEIYSGPIHGETLWRRQFGTASYEEGLGVSVDSTAVYVGGYTSGTLPGQTGLGGNDAFVRKYDLAGNEAWTRQFGTSAGDRVSALSVGASAVYVAGYTDGSFPGQTSAGLDDVFVRRYDLAGNEVWTRQFGTSSLDRVGALSVDSTAVYVGGFTGGTLPGQTSAGANDAFVRKYDLAGNEVWTRQFGTGAWDSVSSLSTDASDVYAAGYTEGALPGQTSEGSHDAFVSKYDSAGNEVWTRQFGTGGWDAALSLSTHSSAVYVGGFTEGTLPGQTTTGLNDAFVRKYDLAGNVVWTRQFGSDEGDYIEGISVCPSGAYVAGYTNGTLPGQTSAGETDPFVRRYDIAGNEIWTRQFGGTDHEAAWAISCDSLAVYVGGFTMGTLPGQVSAGAWDAFVEKLVP